MLKNNEGIFNKIFILPAVVLALFMSFGFCQIAFAADDTYEVIVVKPKVNEIKPELLKDETASVEFKTLIEKYSRDISYDIENMTADSGEAYSRHAKIYIKDTDTVRFEFDDASGNHAYSVLSGGKIWIYFPKTKMIFDLNDDANNGGAKRPDDFISGFLAKPENYNVKLKAENDRKVFEVSEKNGANVIIYSFNSVSVLERIVSYGKDIATSEILLSNVKFEKLNDELFKRPETAVKMNLNNDGGF
ncbi:MAG: hypothetical protein QMC67_00950 [Candidatus Wallbacteria bacterium]